MKLKEIYKEFAISFEVFPPKDDNAKLFEELKTLKSYNPAFISLTYSAGGSNNKSFELIKDIKNLGFDIMPHFTCISSSKSDVEDNLKGIEEINIDKILALRGDIPDDITLIKQDFHYANELVNFIREKTDLSIAVAGYPEGHIESPDIKTDIENLKRKVDAGADVIFTQLFFDNGKFYDFQEHVQNAGITIPIIAGIMPVISKKQINKMTSLAKISIPAKLQTALDDYDDLKSFGIDFATKQCDDLIKNEVCGLHFYTLNKSYSTAKILDNIRR